MTESVVIHRFWQTPIVFHRRGSACDRRSHSYGMCCGHALPRHVAEKIARPCVRCYSNAVLT